MNLFQMAKTDKSLFFSDFPEVEFQRSDAEDKEIWAIKNALVSAIGMNLTPESLQVGVDNFEITYDVNSFAAGTIPREGDFFKYTNEDGDVVLLKIETIAKDKSDVSLGLWLCYATEVAEEDKAGQVNNERK